MSQCIRPGRRHVLRLAAAALAALSTGCAGSRPAPTLYVLGDAAPAPVQPGRAAAVLLLRNVALPDYLDTDDLLWRSGGNVLTASDTGRWAERLGHGMTRALATALARRLPGTDVVTSTGLRDPDWEVLVDVEAFARQPDDRVVLAARWVVVDRARRRDVATERAVIAEPVAGPGDAATVAAMSRAVSRLAEAVVPTVPAAAAARPG